MDHEIDLVVDCERDDLEHVAGGVRAEMQQTLVVEASDKECEIDAVEDVVIVDPVLPRRLMNPGLLT